MATTHKSALNEDNDSMPENEAESLHDAINNASGLMGSHSLEHQLSTKSITGGVGYVSVSLVTLYGNISIMCSPTKLRTVFYVAPEQLNKTKHSESSYGSKADIFSLGILLFEMFNLRPFSTCKFI